MLQEILAELREAGVPCRFAKLLKVAIPSWYWDLLRSSLEGDAESAVRQLLRTFVKMYEG
jgi:hypothetical protein